MQYEFKIAWLVAIGLAFVIGFTIFIRSPFMMTIIGVVFTAVGGFLVAFGFWGADFAFEAERRREDKVHVPFMKDYKPLDWWNLNWFVITIGVFILTVGALFLGFLFGKFVFRI